MFMKKLPVFHNEIGASGRLRELTTEIDSWGNDTVIYFLRKQVHVNASNYNIQLVENIIKSWTYNNVSILKGVVPDEVFNNINWDLLSKYNEVIRPLFKSLGILVGETLSFKKIVQISEEDLAGYLPGYGTPDEIRSKIGLICRIYSEVAKKYAYAGSEKISPGNIREMLSIYLEKLKKLRDVFTSPEETNPEESLYFKRHIAFGIPSVIGTYHEPKFDAFSETLRIEEQVRVLIEALISKIESKTENSSLDDMRDWTCCHEFINDLLTLHDIENSQTNEILTILKFNKLYLGQLIDLLRMWQKELTWAVEKFYRTFHEPLIKVLELFTRDKLPEHLRKISEKDDFLNRAADILIREMLNSIVGFEELDRVMNSLIKTLIFRVESKGDKDKFSLSDDLQIIKKKYFIIDELSSEEAARLAPFLGAKAKNLVYLNNRGLPVPFGVVFSSDHTTDYQKYVESDDFTSTLRAAVNTLERRTGSVFGGEKSPLFLSVRSGSYISMPGILSSILYCGMNETTLNAFIDDTHNPWLAWDSYRRFIQHYADAVFRIDISALEAIMNRYIDKKGVKAMQELGAGQMEEVVRSYQELLSGAGLSIPDDVFIQLKESVNAIYRSWHDEKCLHFRKALNISEHWGTSVTLMQMIYGNDKEAGASVFFTRKPPAFENGIYGETRETATADDLVYGKFSSRPLVKGKSTEGKSLEEIDYELFRKHEEIAERIEGVMGGLPQEVEATYIKGKKIYVLQTKRMEFFGGLTEKFHEECEIESGIIGRGVGVHGGALSGIAVFSKSIETLKKFKNQNNQPVILLTKETSTDDVVVSHASILSQKFNISAVVGCSDMKIKSDENRAAFATFGSYEVNEGNPLSIDGSNGLVYSGTCVMTVRERHG
jgi:pyruvate,orthophosphate dikinase